MLLGIGLFLAAAPASAAPKDDKALKTFKQAMEEDYLDTKFEEAEKKLRSAIDACGSSGCSAPVKAKLYIGLGVVLIGGKNARDEGQKAFADALKLDASAAPDPDYVTSDIKNAFEDAKKSSGSSGSSGPSKPPTAEGPVNVNPIPAQKVNTPVPLYVTLDEDVTKRVMTVSVSYKPVGGGETKTLDLEKSGAKTSSIRKIALNSVKRLVLDRKRLSAKARLFRIKEFARVLIIERSLAEKLREAKPDGVAFESLNKHWS